LPNSRKIRSITRISNTATINSLHIENYVLIDRLDIEFRSGLTVITGPTGAGKSIIIGALGLLLGSKADAAVISGEADSCIVEGEFTVKDDSVRRICEENDIDYEEGRFILRRVIHRSGRSRSFVNDSPVALPALSALGRCLVDIHSQHDTLLLSSSAYQLSVLDRFAGNGSALSRCREQWNKLHDINSEIDVLRQEISNVSLQSEYNRDLYEKLSSAKLRDGEIAELEAEQYALAHSAQIKELLASSRDLLDSEDPHKTGINSLLSDLRHTLERLSAFLPDFKELSDRVESARIDIKDVCEEIESADDKLTCSPERLQSVDDRLALLYGLLKRHGVQTEAELISRRDELKLLAFGSEEMKLRLEDLEKERKAVQADFEAVCTQLHNSRIKAATSFAKGISESLAYMELEHSVFEVELTAAPAGPTGVDEAAFVFSSFGGKPAAVAKCASGGELSRIMLSLKRMMSDFMEMPTVIFDEIDTGVSGSVADKMGSVICDMGGRMQVFAITHLPQVAAKGDAHYLVSKISEGGRTQSSLRELDPQERVMEIARMLSGAALTAEAVANAKALLFH